MRRALPPAPPPPLPWQPPTFELIRKVDHTHTQHAFCACLFREPEYAARLGQYDYEARYQRAGPIGHKLTQWGAHCILFADEASLPAALAMQLGDVYLVTQPRIFPWAQHLWRYYACLLAENQRPACLHFRGMDNIEQEDMQRLHAWAAEGWDVLRAPYHRGRRYYPVRGSVSLAGAGILSMANMLQITPPVQAASWPDAFHPDERLLSAWWRAHHRCLHTLTLIDRPCLAVRAAAEHEAALRAGMRGQLLMQITDRTGPLRTPEPPRIDSHSSE